MTKSAYQNGAVQTITRFSFHKASVWKPELTFLDIFSVNIFLLYFYHAIAL